MKDNQFSNKDAYPALHAIAMHMRFVLTTCVCGHYFGGYVSLYVLLAQQLHYHEASCGHQLQCLPFVWQHLWRASIERDLS